MDWAVVGMPVNGSLLGVVVMLVVPDAAMVWNSQVNAGAT
jgi:hypothetical protein